MEQIVLGKKKSVKGVNEDNSLAVNLKNSKRLLHLDKIVSNISETDVYLSERENCNLLRLSFNVNTIATNVLFNRISEPIINEGSGKNTIPYLYTNTSDNRFANTIVGKNISYYNSDKVVKMTRDTQLSRVYDYHCGLDIFNNHILRSLTFKSSAVKGTLDENYNTLFSLMYQNTNTIKEDGILNNNSNNIVSVIDAPILDEPNITVKLHTYKIEDTLSYKDSINKKLSENNGWFGFLNKATIQISNEENKVSPYLPIQQDNTPSCSFIEMYPEHDKFIFVPLYNKFKNRIEKNWYYFLTYPSRSINEGFSFISNITKGLKVLYYDDTNGLIIWTISKHGLTKGNYINIYKNENVAIYNARVINVINDYCFKVETNGNLLCKEWKKKSDVSENDIIGNKYKDKYYIIGDKILYDDSEISFKRVMGVEECKYYVRVFSKIPNWKHSKQIITEENIDKLLNELNKEKLPKYQSFDNDFTNTIGQLAFARNVYNDPICEVTYTDDIDISYLKDNLGRPLSTIYLTFLKNNEGYEQWYGKNGQPIDYKSDNIEYSHCFGKLTCGFELSKESLGDNYSNILCVNDLDNKSDKYDGLNVKDVINKHRKYSKDSAALNTDEICYKYDTEFYGDLCCYSEDSCYEQSIQDIYGRFNTAQRELSETDSSWEIFKDLYYDEIVSDDYDIDGFQGETKVVKNACQSREGYVYKMHYPISVKSISSYIKTETPLFLSVISILPMTDSSSIYKIRMIDTNKLGLHDKLKIKNVQTNQVYTGECVEVINSKNIKVRIYDKFGKDVKGGFLDYEEDKNKYKFFLKANTIPNYAQLSSSKDCSYKWRDIIQNGMDSSNKEDVEYPFTNGRIYINKNINLFVKRQDPNKWTNIYRKEFPLDAESKKIQDINTNKYYSNNTESC